jgi:hypothetical protein
MTDNEKLDAIRAEIHRLVDVRGYDREMANDLFAFMDSLPNEPVSEGLEEAAIMHFKDAMEYEIETGHKMAHMTSFKAGAKWQEAKDQETLELAEDHAMLAGMEKMKEQMMKDAIGREVAEGSMCPAIETLPVLTHTDMILLPKDKFKSGDKVKIIVIKED